MKKVLFYVVLAVMTLSFASCEGEQTLKDQIAANKNYAGKDNLDRAWEATFTGTTFTATCESAKMSITSSNWDVIENADGTGVISIKDATMVIDKDTFAGEIIGTVDKSAKKINLISGSISITLEKK